MAPKNSENPSYLAESTISSEQMSNGNKIKILRMALRNFPMAYARMFLGKHLKDGFLAMMWNYTSWWKRLFHWGRKHHDTARRIIAALEEMKNPTPGQLEDLINAEIVKMRKVAGFNPVGSMMRRLTYILTYIQAYRQEY